MFSKDVVSQWKFVSMSKSARLLYFCLCMEADDDGFIGNTEGILRVNGLKKSDLTELRKEGYVFLFKDGVAVIAHWFMQNSVRPDRHKNTIHKRELEALSLSPEKIYTPVIPADIPNGNQMSPQYRLVEDSIDKDSIDKIRIESLPPAASESESLQNDDYPDDFNRFWKAYPKKREKLAAFNTWKKVKSIMPPIDSLITSLEALCQSHDWTKDGGKYVPYPERWLKRGGWDDEVSSGSASSYKYGGSVNFEL
jgi:hypothetical protein